MNNEEIRAACAKAASLANSVEDDGLRVAAFESILNMLLRDVGEQGGGEKRPILKATPAQDRDMPKQTKRGGLKARLEELALQSFFAEPRDLSQIAAQFKVAGWNHATKEISARMIELVRAKKLRRAESSINGKKCVALFELVRGEASEWINFYRSRRWHHHDRYRAL